MELNGIEETVFVPMLGRIYASENFPEILYDEKALSLKTKLPKKIKGQDTQTQYTLLAGASRSANIDRYIKDFLKRNEDGVIVELGGGLETTYYRNNNNKTKFYVVDLPEVIEYRKKILGETELNKTISCSILEEEWIQKVRRENPEAPILLTASGLVYYFTKEEIYNMINFLKKYGEIEIVFDIFSGAAMKQVGKYMKQVGHEEAKMYFYLDEVNTIKQELGLKETSQEMYYKYIPKKGLKLSTKITMIGSDMLKMVKMAHFKI